MACRRSLLRSATPLLPRRPRNFHFIVNQFHIRSPYNCNNLNPIAIAIRFRHFHDEDPPQQAAFKAISEVSKTERRVGQTTSDDSSTNEWLALDQKVNSYPTDRGFTAIGTGGEDFVQAMVVAVESVIQKQIPQECVKQKSSSGGKYVSVNIGPIQVVSGEQVQAVYNAMRRDDQTKYFL